MQGIDSKSYDEVMRRFQEVLKSFPEKRKAVINTVGEKMYPVVKGHIAESLNDSNMKIRMWQAKYSGRGYYAAIRAIKGGKGANSPGAITNYLENGHLKRNHRGRVEGRKFYHKSYDDLERIGKAECEKALEEIKREIEK